MSDKNLDRLQEAVSAWTRRPSERSPAIARTRVLAQLGEQRRLPGLGLAAAATAVIGLTVSLLLVTPHSPSDVAVETVSATASTLPRQSMVVYELSSGTKLYLTLTEEPTVAPEGEQGEGS